jgi:hypothetical protein
MIMPRSARLLPAALANFGVFVPSLGELARFGEVLRGQHLLGRSPGHDLAGEQQRFREMLAHLIEIVERGNHGAAFAMPAADEAQEIVDRLGIDSTERLVEQDDGRVLQQQAREQHALELSARESANTAVAQVLQAERGERFKDRKVAPAVQPAPSSDLVPETHGNGVEHRDGEAAVDVDLLRQVGDVAPLQPIEAKAARQRLELPDNALEQGRLACAVRPDEREQIATVNLAGDVVHGRVAVVAERQIVKADGRRLRLGHWSAHSQTKAQSRAEMAPTMARRAGTERRKSEKLCRGGTRASRCSWPMLLLWSMDAHPSQ